MAKKNKQTPLESACDAKLKEIAEELKATSCDSEKIKILTDNAEMLKQAKKIDKKGFKAWVKKIDAADIVKLAFSTGMFIYLVHGENIGKFISSKAQVFIPWGRTPKM